MSDLGSHVPKVCILSNSHSGALVKARDKKQVPFEFDVYAAPNGQQGAIVPLGDGKFTANNDRIVEFWKKTSKQELIDTKNYQALWFHAFCGYSPKLNSEYAKRRNWLFLASNTHGLSSALISAMVNQVVQSNLALMNITVLRNSAEKELPPILVTSEPLPSIDSQYGTIDGAEWMRERWESVWETEANRLGFTYIPQPAETVSSNMISTKAEYVAKKRDIHHMNEEYGGLVLDQVSNALPTLR